MFRKQTSTEQTANTANPTYIHHEDAIKWKHLSRCRPFVWGIQRSPVNSPHEGQWCGALMISLICAWTNGWVNNRDTGDLRRHRVHNDVTEMALFRPHFVRFWTISGGCCNIGYPSETHFKPKSREISFASNSLLSWRIVLKFCTEYDSTLCKISKHSTTDFDTVEKRDWMIGEFKMSFGSISYMTTDSCDPFY